MTTKIQWMLQIKKTMNLRTMTKCERRSMYVWLLIWLTLHDMARERVLHGACDTRYWRPCQWPTPDYLCHHIIICHLLHEDLWNTLPPFLFAWSIPCEEYNTVSFFSFTTLYGEVDQSWWSTYNIKHLTRVISSTSKLKKRWKSSNSTLMDPWSWPKWSLL
jgi:hypothetical protein